MPFPLCPLLLLPLAQRSYGSKQEYIIFTRQNSEGLLVHAARTKQQALWLNLNAPASAALIGLFFNV